MNKRAVIIFGPPGSGKGTQAELLAKKFNLIHFDTGRYGENLIYAAGALKNPTLRRERKNFEEGGLFTPSWILKMVTQATNQIAKSGASIVYSGSPRTMFEAFGDKKHQGLMATLNNLYGKKNITIIKLNVPAKTSLKRNSARFVCSYCGLPLLAKAKIKNCAFCGAPRRKRTLDNPTTIKVRLKEYRDRTLPLIKKLRQQKYRIKEINGRQAPFQISKNIAKILKLQ